VSWLALVANRLFWFVPTLLGLLTIVFILSRVVPVDPAVLMAGENASAEQAQRIREQFGLDQPLIAQFVDYLHDTIRGDLGRSLYTQQPILTDLAARLPATLELAFAASLVALLIGVTLGILAGLHRDTLLDHVLGIATISCMAVAPFWMAMEFQSLFSMDLGWLPLSGRVQGFPPAQVTGFIFLDALITADAGALWSALQHILLPTLTLALPAAATMARFTRNGVIAAMSSPSVDYQMAMGLPRRVIIWKYVLRMAIMATVTQFGLTFAILLTGVVVVETIFDWPGLGSYAINSILQSDYNAVMGFTLCTGVMLITVNLLVDILQAAIDPRGSA